MLRRILIKQKSFNQCYLKLQLVYLLKSDWGIISVLYAINSIFLTI